METDYGRRPFVLRGCVLYAYVMELREAISQRCRRL